MGGAWGLRFPGRPSERGASEKGPKWPRLCESAVDGRTRCVFSGEGCRAPPALFFSRGDVPAEGIPLTPASGGWVHAEQLQLSGLGRAEVGGTGLPGPGEAQQPLLLGGGALLRSTLAMTGGYLNGESCVSPAEPAAGVHADDHGGVLCYESWGASVAVAGAVEVLPGRSCQGPPQSWPVAIAMAPTAWPILRAPPLLPSEPSAGV